MMHCHGPVIQKNFLNESLGRTGIVAAVVPLLGVVQAAVVVLLEVHLKSHAMDRTQDTKLRAMSGQS